MSEDFFSGRQLLGTPDISCGVNTQPIPLVTPLGTLSTSTGAGHCTKNVDTLNEFIGSYGPFSLQGEYYASWYNRDRNALLRDTAAQVVNTATGAINLNATYFNPGGTSLSFSGYYVQAQY
jgi:phosphate-selective porin OprO/OprP